MARDHLHETHPKIVKRLKRADGHQPGRAHAISSGDRDGAGRLAGLCPDGSRDRYGSGGTKAAGYRGDRRVVERDIADAAGSAGSVFLSRV